MRDGETFRMMRYVMRVDNDDKVFLHNVVTGELVVLNQDEAEIVRALPTRYSSVMDELIDHYYLVTEGVDEHQLVSGIRSVLRKLEDNQQKRGITGFTILPTTACNARCYYCFEQGIKVDTMTCQTAENVVKFIKSSCNGQNVQIRWFGGEPTFAADRIDQICEGLSKEGVIFSSRITTNGFLFDEEMVKRAKSCWNLKFAMICVDGTEKNYNTIKSFIGCGSCNPYQRVMRNIGLLLGQGVRVDLRMNFDRNNYQDFQPLLDDVESRFHNNPLLDVYVHQVVGDFSHIDPTLIHGSGKWFQRMICDLNKLSCERGMHRYHYSLPFLKYHWCQAANEHSVTITPQGALVSCPEQLGESEIKGDVEHGLTNFDLIQSWKNFGEYEDCHECVLFPDCVKIASCNSTYCYGKEEKMYLYEKAIRDQVVSLPN